MKESKKNYIGFIIAGVILVLAAFIALAIQINSLANIDFDKVKFTAPGTKEITLDSAGRYVVFYEYKSDYAGRNYNTKSENLSNLRINISESRSNNSIDWYYSRTTTRYDFKNAGVSWVKFNLPEPVTIRIDTFYEGGYGPEVVLVVARNFVVTILKRVFIMLVSFFGLIVIGVVLFFIPPILNSSKRRKTAKNLPE